MPILSLVTFLPLVGVAGILALRLSSRADTPRAVETSKWIALISTLATFLAPLVAIVPYEAATPALVIVGFLMMQQVKGISWDDLEIAIPAFLTIVLMPFTYSITAGIGAGFVTYVFIKLIRRKSSSIHPLMWLVAALFVIYFAIDPIKALLHID